MSYGTGIMQQAIVVDTLLRSCPELTGTTVGGGNQVAQVG